MNKLLLFVLIGISFNAQAQIYELYRNFGLVSEGMNGANMILLSNKTGKPNQFGKQTWGPTKQVVREQGALKKLGKKQNGPLKIQNGNYIVLIKNDKTQPKTKTGEQFMWVSMGHILPSVQQNQYQEIQGEMGKPGFYLDKDFFNALVNDNKNSQGFVANSVNIPGLLVDVDLDSSSF